MTSFELRPSSARPIARPMRTGGMVQRALLACGILSSLLYVAADLLGGLRYEGYSFTSLSAPNGARLAAGLPTPGFGIVERIDIYSSLLWIAVLAVVLLRRPIARDMRVLP